MRQLVVAGSGEVRLDEVAPPSLRPGQVLVETTHSLISAGTEAVAVAGGSLTRKLIAKPALAAKTLRLAREQGVKAAAMAVRDRVARTDPLGYSLCGRVVASMALNAVYPPGQRVACAGAGWANHAELVAVPESLVVPVPEGLAPELASVVAVGAIALQGIRQGGVTVGDRVAVIGLGLVGQLAGRLARACGARVGGFDPSGERRALARSFLDEVLSEDLAGACDSYDVVLICAASDSPEPLETAFKVARDRGRVVVVGVVGLGAQTGEMLRKELQVVGSRSYGPGRYDPAYEEAGIDYPIGYVRWTERRNMECVLSLLASGAAPAGGLITHRFLLDEAPTAYQMLRSADASRIGMVLVYPAAERADVRQAPRVPAAAPRRLSRPQDGGALGVGLVGFGAFAADVVVPALRERKGVSVRGVVSQRTHVTSHASWKTGGARVVSSLPDLLADSTVEVVLVTNRHADHAATALACLAADRGVFVEKPLALTMRDAQDVCAAALEAGLPFSVGFNRTFSPMARRAAEHLRRAGGRLSLDYRVNAPVLPAGHWMLDPDVGGGRILGEVCHFVDFAIWLAGGPPTSVVAVAPGRGAPRRAQEVTAVFRFADDSTAMIQYVVSGARALGKERIEGIRGSRCFVIDDFESLELDGERVQAGRPDKGHGVLLGAFVDRCLDRSLEDPVSPTRALTSMEWTFAILESVRAASEVRAGDPADPVGDALHEQVLGDVQ